MKAPPFKVEDIEDVRIIIKAKGKHYGLVSKSRKDDATDKSLRLLVCKIILQTHAIIDLPLEEIEEAE